MELGHAWDSVREFLCFRGRSHGWHRREDEVEKLTELTSCVVDVWPDDYTKSECLCCSDRRLSGKAICLSVCPLWHFFLSTLLKNNLGIINHIYLNYIVQ